MTHISHRAAASARSALGSTLTYASPSGPRLRHSLRRHEPPLDVFGRAHVEQRFVPESSPTADDDAMPRVRAADDVIAPRVARAHRRSA